jgi:acetyl esterase
VYGWYDLGGTPSMRAFRRRLVFSGEELKWMASLLVPDTSRRLARAGPEAGGCSPLYSPLHALPRALFTVGTDDALCDDTLFLAARWAAHGLPAELEVYPGAAHGLGHFGPHEFTSQGQHSNDRVHRYLSLALRT